jgi:RNA 2',3'-cyclic 3'-phosphodiesterase
VILTEHDNPHCKLPLSQAIHGAPSFNLIASGIGAFPNLRNPRVFWVGIKNAAQQLIPLQRQIQQQLEQTGFGKEDKPFSPHLTIGRVRQGSARETAEKIKQTEFADEAFIVKEVIIMRSELQPAGSKYTPLAVLKLAQ